ncbi:MAG TPA: ATP-binding protein [Verrucomicrobiae bacterium]|nr:ATP-binding protein [Verrucomicrobiae bacterium]
MSALQTLREDRGTELNIGCFGAASAGEMTSFRRSNPAAAVPLWRRYTVAALCVILAFFVRYLLTPLLGAELPFMLFIAAALIAAWYGGAVCGMAALLVGLLLADSIFVQSNAIDQPVEIVRFVRYVFTASLGVGLIEVLHRSKQRTEAMVENLKKEVERRTSSERLLLEAEIQLRHHAQNLERRVGQQTAKLADTVEALKNLLYFIAHNLRAPLRAMEGYASLLVSECASNLDTRAKDYSRHISIAAKRMDLLIQGLLDYGRLQHAELSLEQVSLDKVVGKALFGLNYEVRARGAEVQVIGPLPWVLANEFVLEAVVANLLENAMKFVSPGTVPRVQVWSEPRDSRVRLWVSDNGIGIDPKFHEKIFDAFEILPLGEHTHGTGIGLAIVMQGVRRMGGQVGVESQPGAGSRFWLELPAGTRAQQ